MFSFQKTQAEEIPLLPPMSNAEKSQKEPVKDVAPGDVQEVHSGSAEIPSNEGHPTVSLT